MGGSLSQIIQDAREAGGQEVVFSDLDKIKSKEVVHLIQTLKQEFPDLKSLTVNSCKVKKLPEDFGKHMSPLKSLRTLRLENNSIASLPDSCNELTGLLELSFIGNKLSEFPKSMNPLITNSLGTLDLTNNQISNLNTLNPVGVASIEVFRLKKNFFTEFPLQLIFLKSSLKVLDLSDNQITSLPNEINQLENLHQFLMRGNKLTVSPKITKMKNLELLDLSENQLSKLVPETFKDIVALKRLELQHNKIESIPSEFYAYFGKLKSLKVNDNKLQELEPEIGTLSSLQELYLQENNLSTLPKEIAKLSSLRKLFLEYNQINSLPSELDHLKKLVVLILHHNELKTVPECISNLKSLLRFSLEDNPLDDRTLNVIRREGALSLISKREMRYSTSSSMPTRRTLDDSSSSLEVPEIPTTSKTISSATASTLSPKPSRFQLSFGTLGRTLSNAVSPLRDKSPRTSSLDHSPRNRSNTVSSPSTSSVGSALELQNSRSTLRLVRLQKSRDDGSDSEDDVPAFSKFKHLFDSFMEELDLSRQKKEILSRMSTEKKWLFMKEYKQSTLNLLKLVTNQTLNKNTKLKKTPPQDFINMLRSKRASRKDLQTLLAHLSENSDAWMPNFVELGGISVLVEYLEKLSTYDVTHRNKFPEFYLATDSLILECLAILKLLLESAIRSVLIIGDSINCIALNYDHPETDIKHKALDLLAIVCQTPHIGPQMVLEALQYQQVKRNSETPYTVNLVKTIESSWKHNQDLLLTTIQLINDLVNNMEELESRYQLRLALINSGLLSVFRTLRKNSTRLIIMYVDTFEEAMRQDEEDLLSKYGRNEVWHKIRKEHSTNPNINQIRVTCVLEASLHITPSLTISYKPDMLVSEAMRSISKNYGLMDYSDFGLYLISDGSDPKILDIDKTMEECGLKGEVFAEFKYKPWLTEVVLLDRNITRRQHVDPNLDVASVTKNLVKIFPEIPTNRDDDDFKLFIVKENDQRPSEIALEEVRRLFEYSIHFKYNEGKVYFSLRLKPLPMKVLVGNDVKVFYFQANTKLTDAKIEVIEKLSASSRKMSAGDYGLRLEKENESNWVDETLEIKDADLEPGIRLVLKPRPFQVKLLDEQENKDIVLDFTSVVSDLISKICEIVKLSEEKSEYSLYYQVGSETKMILLDPNFTFRDQSVPIDAILHLKKRGEGDSKTEDVNIWEDTEPVSFETEDKSQISYATFNKLVEFLTSSQNLNRDFLDVFLMMYKSVTTPEHLFNKLMQRYNVPPSVPTEEANKIKIRVCLFFKSWMENQYDSAASQKVRDKVVAFVEGPVTEEFPQLASGLLKSANKPKRSPSMDSTITVTEPPPKPKLPKNLNEKLTLFDIDPIELTRQLTIICFGIYVDLEHTEFFGQSWTKPAIAHERSPNLLALIDYFNSVTRWISTSILLEKKIRYRVKAWEYFIKVAQHARELNNFHLLVAIISAFSHAAMLRLKWTQEKLSKKAKQILTELEEFMSMKRAFKTLREAIKSVTPPCIPYIGVYLTDLVFIEDGNPNQIGNRINFSKQYYIYNIISTVQKFQAFPYNFASVPSIIQFYQQGIRVSDDQLWTLSLGAEPRGATRQDIQ